MQHQKLVLIALIASIARPAFGDGLVTLFPPDFSLYSASAKIEKIGPTHYQINEVPSGTIPAFVSVEGITSPIAMDGFSDGSTKRSISFRSQAMKPTVTWSGIVTTLPSQITYTLETGGQLSTLNGQITVTNRTDMPLSNIHFQAKIGDPLFRDGTPVAIPLKSVADFRISALVDDACYFYDITPNITLQIGQTVTIPIFSVQSIREKTIFVLQGNRQADNDIPTQLERVLVFKNTANRHLAPGHVNVVRNGQLIAIASLPGTPIDGEIRLSTGRSFDITATRKVTSRTVDGLREDIVDISVSNASNKLAPIEIYESAWGNTTIVKGSQGYQRLGNNRFLFQMALAPKQAQSLQYVIRFLP